ncbi:coiled-coil domain-containing protein [Halomonas sp. MS1]|nr:hypothetical protein [Halomonas sp. MS1]UTD55913.1 hypothetical protein NF683_01455 [Halomonas sp. MS1]
MTEVAEKESTDLITVPSKETVLDVFKGEKGLDPYLLTIRRELDRFLETPPSLDTKKGRDAYASMAFKIARSKTTIDNIGKELVDDLKQLPKTIDAERKRWRDQLDEWRDEARGPLNQWEAAEEARKAKHQAEIHQLRQSAELFNEVTSQEIDVRISQLEAVEIGEAFEEYEAEAHRVKAAGLSTLKTALDRQKKYEADQAELERMRQEAAEREQKEREERIAREAEERARREAEEKARAEREAVARREQEARDEAARKEREYQEGIAKAQREAEAEKQRIEHEHRRMEEERIAEQKRQEQARLDAERREREEVERRQADVEHRRRINQTAMQAMIDGGMPEQCAKDAVTLIIQGKVPNISINY